jgi:hypothetical protein
MAATDVIFTNPIFTDFILPFVLVFVLIFGILQKTKIFGEGKKQVDALISLTIGLILIGFPYSRGLVLKLIPFLAVSALILLIYMMLFGFIWGREVNVLTMAVKVVVAIIFSIAFVVYILYITGYFDTVFKGNNSGALWVNIFLVAVFAGAIVAVVLGDKGKKSSG